MSEHLLVVVAEVKHAPLADQIEQLYQHLTTTRRSNFFIVDGHLHWNVLFLIRDGEFTFTMDGHTYHIGPNEAAFTPQDIHFSRQIITPISYHLFRFFITPDENNTFLPAVGNYKLNLPHTYVKEMLDLLDQVYQKQLPDRNPIYQNCLDHLLMAQHIRNQNALTVGVDRDVNTAIEYMSAHLAEPIRIGNLAESLHLTHTGLIGKFKRVHGCTPNEYLVRLRIELARRLIAEGKLRINEIASACGYANAYYFSNAFHAHVGLSPSAYRESLRANGKEHLS